MVTEVIIHFIGLCLFTAGLPNDSGVHVMLPRIHHSLVFEHQVHNETARTVMTPIDSNTVENHTAMIVFPSAIVDVANSTWPAENIPGNPTNLQGYQYVVLDGDRITFQVGGANPTSAIPGDLPKILCNGPSSFASGYQNPYPSASAVIDIPNGVLNACDPGPIAPGRIDTKLALKTTGTLTIVSTTMTKVKKLILKINTDQRIFVANIPMAWAQGNQTTGHGAAHYNAYFAMIGMNKNLCQQPTGSVTLKCAADSPLLKPGRGKGRGTITAAKTNDPLMTLVANSECSNTQWP